MSDLCPNCGRPQATPEMEGDENGTCFLALNAEDESIKLDCYEIAVPRLQGMVTAAGSGGWIVETRQAPDVSALRARFAGLAMQGILSDASAGGVEHGDPVAVYQVCKRATAYADALVAGLGLEVKP